MIQDQRALNSESFSLHDDGPDFSQDHIQRPHDLRNMKNRSDSPEFGYPETSQKSEPMLIDDKIHDISPVGSRDIAVKGGDGKRGVQNPEEVIADLKEKIKQATASLREQQDENKAQILHIETISMMTKYQLVFIKMESALLKVAHIIKNKESSNATNAFQKILEHSKASQTIKKYRTQLIYYNLKDNTQTLTTAINNLYKGCMLKGFKAIWLKSKAWKTEKLYKEEKDKYLKTLNDAIIAKDKEIAQYAKKIDELNNSVLASKSKENDFITKIKHKEKQIAALEMEKGDILKAKKSISGDSTNTSIRILEERIRDLQQDNEDLKDKLSSAEGNVSVFIKEMSELLDTHELSMNIGSDDNASFHNAEIEEEFDVATKIKDKGIGNQNRTKENQNKPYTAQRSGGYQPANNKYQKLQHI